jgi:RHS repeat-associated protein
VDATYQYDALTRRVITADAAETRHFYFNNQWRAVEERVSGAVKAQYVWNPADRWDLIRRRRSVAGTLDETRFVLRDYLDSAAIINPGGVVTERYRYDAFGPATVLAPDFSVLAASECGWNFLYHAEFIDASTGLYNYGFRFYHPTLGRWISRDPIGERGGVNLFGFVGNDAENKLDLLGRSELWTISGINSVAPGNGPVGPLEDYVGKYLAQKGMKPDKSEHSNSGTAGLNNWNYICPGGNPFVLHPWSKSALDKEADEYSKRCCKRKEFCGKKICIVMIAPKTATPPPKSGCCKLNIKTWWDPYDPVPNQGIGGKAVQETQQHWSQYGDAFPVMTSEFGFLGNHSFIPFMQANSMYDPNWMPNPLDTAGGKRRLSGRKAPNPMDTIKEFRSQCDITIVCHSQGCNITMAIINRGCTK